MNIYSGLWFTSGHKCQSGEMVDCSHKVNNRYKWHILSLVQNLLEDHPSDMDTLHGHHSDMAGRVKWLEAHDLIRVNGH